MKHSDVEELAVKAGMQSALNMGAGSCAWTEGCEGVSQQHLQRFAALVLEKAAQVCDGQVERWIDDRARYCASECAAGIRAMSAALQSGDRG